MPSVVDGPRCAYNFFFFLTADLGPTRFRRDDPPAITLPIGYEKSTQGCQGITATLTTSDDFVRPCQITMRLLLNIYLL